MTVADERIRAENCGPRYDRLMMLETRRRTRDAIRRVAARISPGMTASDAFAITREELRADGLVRGWHGINIRFGANTLKPFDEPSEPGVALGDDDIYFIDIGPHARDGRAGPG